MKKSLQNLPAIYLITILLLFGLPAFSADTRLYIATNKESFSPSEKIQFQAFLINPSAKTNYSLFTELIDCYGNHIGKKMLPLNFNIASGDFDLPGSANAEFYILYCYVVNDSGMECNYTKKIFITGKGSQSIQNLKKQYSLVTYFEGGTFIAESPNNILLQCLDENEQPAIIKGKIADDQNRVYTVFETNERGLAKVNLNPEDKVNYSVIFKDKSGQEFTSPLPVAASSGITLNAGIIEGTIKYNLISFTGRNDQLLDYKIEAICNQQIIYDAAISFQKGLSVVNEELKKENFPAGFITFRLVDKSNKVFAQRTIYNPILKPVANFIRIIDTLNNKETRVELPGYISGKGYINIGFENHTTQSETSTEFLDLSDSSLSFNDQLIATFNPPGVYENKNINRYLSISGTVFNKDRTPLANTKVNLILLYRNFNKQFLTATSDNKGKLKIDNLLFFDSVKVYYQLGDKSVEKNDVFINFAVMPFADTVNLMNPDLTLVCADNLNHTDSSGNKLNRDEKTLQSVVVTAEKEKTESEKFEDKYVSGQFKQTNMLRNKLDLIENPREVDNVNLFDYIRGQVPSLKIFTNSSGSPIIEATSGGTVGVYLNDMLLDGNFSLLSNLQIKDVALIKYYSVSLQPRPDGRNPFLDFRAGDGGSLYIYTKRDYSPDEEKTKGLPKTYIRGYDLAKPAITAEFNAYNPESIYWKPDWNAENGQTIYLALPPGKTEYHLQLLIEGINDFMAPYRFSQKLSFN